MASAFKTGQVLSVIAVHTAPEDAGAFVKTFSEGPKASHSMPGFEGLAVAEDTREPGSFLVVSLWKDEGALNGYVRSPGFGADHASAGAVKSAQSQRPGRFVIRES